jgi:hypothetical protein
MVSHVFGVHSFVVTTLPLVFPDYIFGNNGQFQFLVISAGGGCDGKYNNYDALLPLPASRNFFGNEEYLNNVFSLQLLKKILFLFKSDKNDP